MPWRLPKKSLLGDRNTVLVGDSCLKGGEWRGGEGVERSVECKEEEDKGRVGKREGKAVEGSPDYLGGIGTRVTV